MPMLDDEHDLLSYLMEYLHANMTYPRVAGKDFTGRPFVAWITDTGPLMVVLIDIEKGDTLGSFRGGPGILNYPVTLLE